MTQKEELLIKAILESPFAPALVARLSAALEDEKKRRLQFYQDIDDDMKVEFINGEIVVHSPVKFDENANLEALRKLMAG